MTDTKTPASRHESRHKVTVLDGLSDRQQDAIAHEYEARTGRSFRCQQCLETGTGHSLRADAEADEPGGEVVAILEESSGPIPLCEDCYRRLMDSSRTL